MKSTFRYIFLASSVALAAGAMVSCSDDTDAKKDKGATPVVKYVRPTDINKADSLLVGASLGDKIVIVGDNLGDVQRVWFNNCQASLSPNMVTSHTIIVNIPNVIPTEVTGNIRLITSQGIEIQYPFNVIVPAPRVEAMSCEWAKPGSSVTISGSYFADDPNVPITVTFPGDKQAKITSIKEDLLTVTVPDDCIEGPVTVSSIYGSTESVFHYKDTRGMLFDFDPDGITGLGTSQSWHARPLIDDENSLSGTYMVIGNGEKPMSANGDWDDGNYSFEYWAGSWNTPTDYPARQGERLYNLADFNDFNDKALKFEICIPASNAWQSGGMHCVFSPSDAVSFGNAGVDIFGNTVAGCNNDYIHNKANKGQGLGRYIWIPWTEAEAYHTNGEWITVTLPLKDFNLNSDGTSPERTLVKPTDFANLQLFIWGGDEGAIKGVECTPLLFIDNIRVVKY